MTHKVYYIMGVSGSGKTTIGQLLSQDTGYPFYDADNFHSAENIAKMQAGIPLTDEDRLPWLRQINAFVVEAIQQQPIIFVCSALKEKYRALLSGSIEHRCQWIMLEGSLATIQNRLHQRKGHYMPPTLLQSQFEALETPVNAIKVDISSSPAVIVAELLSAIKGEPTL